MLFSISFCSFFSFFFNDTATTEIYTLSLHDALPILPLALVGLSITSARAQTEERVVVTGDDVTSAYGAPGGLSRSRDRKSTRLNSSHPSISYAVFCLKKKKKNKIHILYITITITYIK